MQSGIYAIICTKTGRRYIGSAANLLKRWNTHRSYLKRGDHQNSFLQRAWNKYGSENFSFEILELISESSRLIEVEQSWLDKSDNLFNARKIAHSNLGVRHTPKTKEKLRKIAKLRGVYEETRRAQRKAMIGRKHSDAHRSAISVGNTGKIRSEEARVRMSELAKRRSRKHLDAISESLSETWCLTDPEDQTHIVKNLTRFSNINGLNASHLYAVANGKRKHHRGWTAKRMIDLSNAESASDRYIHDQSADDTGLRRFLGET